MHLASLPHIQLQAGKKIYFASDFHFGIPDKVSSKQRELLVCEWLEEISKDAQHIFLLGDLFDAWLEYKTVVPKGNVRFLGKLALLRDKGINITVFTGNHDLWMYGYFEEELQINVLHKPVKLKINQLEVVLGHGDGLGPGDHGYKRLKKFLNNKICQWCYRWIHPDIGIKMANYFSGRGLEKKSEVEKYLGDEKEYLVLFCKDYLKEQHAHYFIFGHRHYLKSISLGSNRTYLNLGDWLHFNGYAVCNGIDIQLLQYKK
jgi:UDP-2,3-diacylglucosamine hydrolase